MPQEKTEDDYREPFYSGTPAGHTSTGTGGASCPATYNLAYPPFAPSSKVRTARATLAVEETRHMS